MKRNSVRTRKWVSRRIRLTQIGFLFSALSIALIALPTLPPPLEQTTKARTVVSNGSVPAHECPACAQAWTQTIYAPLIDLAESSGTEINLNCRSPHALQVTPTFYTKKGEAFTGEAFEMDPAEVKTVDLKTLMPRSIRSRHDLGGMTLSHTGQLMEMWGQLRLLRVGGGDSVDVTFVNISDKRSDVRDAVWLMPEHGSAAIAIGNLGTRAVTAKLQFSNGDYQEVDVPSFGTELIRRHRGQAGSNAADGVRITAADGSGDLIPAGAVTGNFASSIRFYDTKNVAQQNLYATNVRLHHVSSTVVLRNAGTQSVLATPRLRPAQGDRNDFIDLETINLAPDEIRSVDLTLISTATERRSDFDDVSIEVLNSGSKGSLIGALNGVDERTGLSYDVPLRDSGGPRNLSGAYPWRLDGDVSTIVSITNASAADSQFVVQINYPGGPYLLEPRKLAPGDTATFDLRKIRDQQIPDRNGHTIPKSVEGGQFRWFIHSGGHLIGRAEMLSVARRISSSYSCGNPCPPRFDHGLTQPEPITVPVGDSVDQAFLEVDVDSYNNEYGPYTATVDYEWSWDTSIATMESGTVTGISAGGTGTSATVEYPLYVNWDGDCTWYGTNQANVNGSVDVFVPVINLGSATFTSPNPATIHNGETATLTVVISTQGVRSSPVGLQFSIINATGPEVTLNQPGDTTVTVGAEDNQVHNQNFTFTYEATSNPASPAQVTAHVKMVSVQGTTGTLGVLEKDSGVLTISHKD